MGVGAQQGAGGFDPVVGKSEAERDHERGDEFARFLFGELPEVVAERAKDGGGRIECGEFDEEHGEADAGAHAEGGDGGGDGFYRIFGKACGEAFECPTGRSVDGGVFHAEEFEDVGNDGGITDFAQQREGVFDEDNFVVRDLFPGPTAEQADEERDDGSTFGQEFVDAGLIEIAIQLEAMEETMEAEAFCDFDGFVFALFFKTFDEAFHVFGGVAFGFFVDEHFTEGEGHDSGGEVLVVGVDFGEAHVAGVVAGVGGGEGPVEFFGAGGVGFGGEDKADVVEGVGPEEEICGGGFGNATEFVVFEDFGSDFGVRDRGEEHGNFNCRNCR